MIYLCYFVIVVIQPYLNKFIKSIEKFTGLFIIIILTILAEFWNLHGGWKDAWSYLSPWMVFYVCIYYLTGAWISFHYGDRIINLKSKKALYSSIFFGIVSICYFCFFHKITSFIDDKSVTPNCFTTLFQFMCGTSLLIFFNCLPPIKYSLLEKIIKFAGWVSLGIYLMHGPVFITLDLIWPIPQNVSLMYSIGRFTAYYLISIPIAAFMTWFVLIQDNFFWKKWNTYKICKKSN